MTDDLVKRAAQAMMRAEPWSSFWSEADAEKLASTAVALALEEAAKVATENTHLRDGITAIYQCSTQPRVIRIARALLNGDKWRDA